MRRNRFSYSLVILLCLVLFFLYEKPFLLGMALFLIALAVLMAFLVKLDAGKIGVSLSVNPVGTEGNEIPLHFTIERRGRILAARDVCIKARIQNKLLGTEETREYSFPLENGGKDFVIEGKANFCGEHIVRCEELQIREMLGLFSAKGNPFSEIHAIIYPGSMELEVEIPDFDGGTTRDAGVAQNRKGRDSSEIFQIQEYAPGDDIRAVHWKLSGKMQQLMIRQFSDDSKMRIAVLADLGSFQGEEAFKEEINRAAALGAALGEQLIRRGIMFSLYFATPQGLQCIPVRNEQDFSEMLALWLATPLQCSQGTGLEYFLMEHLEQYFSRLLILSTGNYEQDLMKLEQELQVTVLTASAEAKSIRADKRGHYNMIVFPTEAYPAGSYHIVC